MKKYIAYLAAALTLVGCEEDLSVFNTTTAPQNALTVSLPTTCSDETRVAFTDGESAISLSWEQGDSFTVYDSDGYKVADYTYYAAGSSSSSAIFTSDSDTNPLSVGSDYTAIYPAVEGATTIDEHRTTLASRIAEQTQVGNNTTSHLNQTLRMEASFTYRAESDTKITFAHTLATMRITFTLSDTTPATLEFRDGDYATYTIQMGSIQQTDSYTLYYVINPNEGTERTLTFTLTTTDGTQQTFYVTSSITYTTGNNYIASVPGFTYTPIYTAENLYNVRNNLSDNYILMNDIDLSDYDNWTPIGSSSSIYFSGIFEGDGHTITGLTINSSSSYQGLFGYTEGATIKNTLIKEPSIVGGSYTAALVGYGTSTTITSSGVEGGSVSGSSYVGGVVGRTYSSTSTVSACYNTGSVSGTSDYVGGVVGYAYSTVSTCYYLPYSGVTYRSTTDGTADENLVSTMTSSSFPTTLNTAAGDSYWEYDTYNYNNGYPILIAIDYTTLNN